VPFRLLVNDKNTAVAWYQNLLGFEVTEEWGPAFAILSKGNDVLWISGPQTSAAKPMSDGAKPVPGGWNRIVVQVEDLEMTMKNLRDAGTFFRNEPVSGPGGTQVLVEDPSGNPVEVFQAN
jgi:catechol 2,3-dioxygenase-like lactoylglutathione lyase family enzyme